MPAGSFSSFVPCLLYAFSLSLSLQYWPLLALILPLTYIVTSKNKPRFASYRNSFSFFGHISVFRFPCSPTNLSQIRLRTLSLASSLPSFPPPYSRSATRSCTQAALVTFLSRRARREETNLSRRVSCSTAISVFKCSSFNSPSLLSSVMHSAR